MNNVYWITGLSGAGKTTVGKALYEKIKPYYPNIVFLDGDELREVFSGTLGYAKEDRKNVAKRYSKLCRMLSKQGLNVVICTISMFHEVRSWNRKNIDGYIEIYLKAPIEVLRQRDKKGLYKGYDKGTVGNLVGVDIEIEEPISPDLVLETDKLSVDETVGRVVEYLQNRDAG